MTADNVYCLGTDDAGNLWAGTIADGLAVYSPSEDRFKAVTAFPNIEKKGITNIALESGGIYPEFYDPDHVVLMVSPQNDPAELRRLEELAADLQARSDEMQAQLLKAPRIVGPRRMMRAFPDLKHGVKKTSLKILANPVVEALQG